MAYFHGVRITESPTPLQVPAAVDSALPVAIGVAPVHRLENPAMAVNNPALLFNFSEGVADMGYMDPATLEEIPIVNDDVFTIPRTLGFAVGFDQCMGSA